MKSLRRMAAYLTGLCLLMSVLVPCRVVNAEEKKGNEDIVTIVANNPQFSTLAALLKAAGLIDALEGEGPFTVFAPTNEAFNKLPEGTLTELLKPENKQKLEDILTYHVYPGKVTAQEAAGLNNQDITMLNNKKAKITVKDNAININDAKVIQKDTMASNGIIHTIDKVLLPET